MGVGRDIYISISNPFLITEIFFFPIFVLFSFSSKNLFSIRVRDSKFELKLTSLEEPLILIDFSLHVMVPVHEDLTDLSLWKIDLQTCIHTLTCTDNRKLIYIERNFLTKIAQCIMAKHKIQCILYIYKKKIVIINSIKPCRIVPWKDAAESLGHNLFNHIIIIHSPFLISHLLTLCTFPLFSYWFLGIQLQPRK